MVNSIRIFRRWFVRVLKWAGTVVCALTVVGYAMNAWGYVAWSGDYVSLFVDRGVVQVIYDFDEPLATRLSITPTYAAAGLQGGTHSYAIQLLKGPTLVSLNGELARSGLWRIPLWLPLLVVAPATLLLWRLDRRVAPGHCRRCRYNLTGNTTGVCPECGTAFAPAAR